MQRQLGATKVRIDTEAGYAAYSLLEPEELAFALVEEATHGAGYTMRRVEIELDGRFVERDCQTCRAPKTFFEVEGTGQFFEVVGELPADKEGVRVRGSVSGWSGGHTRMEIVGSGLSP